MLVWEKKQAQPISLSEKEKLWDQGLLGDSTPYVLIGMLVFMCGMYFVLRSGCEHQQLCPAMLSLVEHKDGRAYVEYAELGSKNNPGGLKESVIMLFEHMLIVITLQVLLILTSFICPSDMKRHH